MRRCILCHILHPCASTLVCESVLNRHTPNPFQGREQRRRGSRRCRGCALLNLTAMFSANNCTKYPGPSLLTVFNSLTSSWFCHWPTSAVTCRLQRCLTLAQRSRWQRKPLRFTARIARVFCSSVLMPLGHLLASSHETMCSLSRESPCPSMWISRLFLASFWPVAFAIDTCHHLLPVVPRKAVAEVSEKETYRRVWLLWVTDGRVNPLMDWKVVGAVFFGVATLVAVVTWSVTSPTTAGSSVV